MALNDGYQKHSIKRAAERYGISLDMAEYRALSAAIAFHELTAAPECVRLRQLGSGREAWAIWHKGEWLPLVFDVGQARIVTLLPASVLRQFRHKLPW